MYLRCASKFFACMSCFQMFLFKKWTACYNLHWSFIKFKDKGCPWRLYRWYQWWQYGSWSPNFKITIPFPFDRVQTWAWQCQLYENEDIFTRKSNRNHTGVCIWILYRLSTCASAYKLHRYTVCQCKTILNKKLDVLMMI